MRNKIIAVPILSQLGWVREETNGKWSPVQRAHVMGFIVDLAQGRIYIPEAKIACAQALCSPDKLLRQTMTRRELASLFWMLSSLKRAALLIQLSLRQAYPNNWKTNISSHTEGTCSTLTGSALLDWQQI